MQLSELLKLLFELRSQNLNRLGVIIFKLLDTLFESLLDVVELCTLVAEIGVARLVFAAVFQGTTIFTRITVDIPRYIIL